MPRVLRFRVDHDRRVRFLPSRTLAVYNSTPPHQRRVRFLPANVLAVYNYKRFSYTVGCLGDKKRTRRLARAAYGACGLWRVRHTARKKADKTPDPRRPPLPSAPALASPGLVSFYRRPSRRPPRARPGSWRPCGWCRSSCPERRRSDASVRTRTSGCSTRGRQWRSACGRWCRHCRASARPR